MPTLGAINSGTNLIPAVLGTTVSKTADYTMLATDFQVLAANNDGGAPSTKTMTLPTAATTGQIVIIVATGARTLRTPSRWLVVAPIRSTAVLRLRS